MHTKINYRQTDSKSFLIARELGSTRLFTADHKMVYPRSEKLWHKYSTALRIYTNIQGIPHYYVSSNTLCQSRVIYVYEIVIRGYTYMRIRILEPPFVGMQMYQK